MYTKACEVVIHQLLVQYLYVIFNGVLPRRSQAVFSVKLYFIACMFRLLNQRLLFSRFQLASSRGHRLRVRAENLLVLQDCISVSSVCIKCVLYTDTSWPLRTVLIAAREGVRGYRGPVILSSINTCFHFNAFCCYIV